MNQKDTKYNGKNYRVGSSENYPDFIDVVEFEEREDTYGAFAKQWAEATGKPLMKRHYYKVDRPTRFAVIANCGPKFSRSKAWRDIYWLATNQINHEKNNG